MLLRACLGPAALGNPEAVVRLHLWAVILLQFTKEIFSINLISFLALGQVESDLEHLLSQRPIFCLDTHVSCRSSLTKVKEEAVLHAGCLG